jgi:phosphate transport system substrate-binding protein
MSAAFAADMTGAGATFPYPIYAKWAEMYKAATGNGLNYQSVGSGAGIKQIKAKTVDFGASDMPLESGRTGRSGPDAVPGHHGRRGRRRQRRRRRARAS